MAAKKAATKQPAKAKAGITAEQPQPLGHRHRQGQRLKVYYEAAKNVCNRPQGLSL